MTLHYLPFLARLHEAVDPGVYLEIGAEFGTSLALSRTHSIAIDPGMDLRASALREKPWIKLYRQESDAFFATHTPESVLEGMPLDLVFIDGFHEFSQVVRDLEHVERWGHTGTAVVIHDVIPFNARHASRQFRRGEWTGDVWRVVPFLREHRPDLSSRLVDVADTGALVVTGLDPGFRGMAELAEELNQVYPPDGSAYERLVVAYLASIAPEPAAAFLHQFPGLARPIQHRIERAGWRAAPGTNELTPVAGAADHSFRIVPAEAIRFGLRMRLALTARGMQAFRLGFRGVREGEAMRERSVFVDVARPGALSHDLERVALHTNPALSFFELEVEGTLGAGERLREIVVQPAGDDLQDIPATQGMALAMQSAAIEQIPAVSRVTRFLPEHIAGRPVPAKRRDGKRDAVVFAWFVPERMPEIGEYYANLLHYYHPDSRIFVGMNHGSDPVWEGRLRRSELDVRICHVPSHIRINSDAGGFLAALDAWRQESESFDLVWFGHTKGASKGRFGDYLAMRYTLLRSFWARRDEIEGFFRDSRIGIYSARFSPLPIPPYGDELRALQRVYQGSHAPLGLHAKETFFVMRDDIVRRFCDAVGDQFFQRPPGGYGAGRYFFEVGFPNIASMQGFEPFIDPHVAGEGHPRDDVWLFYDAKQNHRLANRELERWRADPFGFEPREMQHAFSPHE